MSNSRLNWAWNPPGRTCGKTSCIESPQLHRSFLKGDTMKTAKPQSSIVKDVQAIRERARQHIEEGALTADYKADPETVVKLLNDALATEIVCVLRYKRHYFMAQGMNAESVKAEFLAHAAEEQAHADALAERIVQLDRKSTRLNSSHQKISYAVFCL